MTKLEESPDYPAKVAAYLAKTNATRLPWGTIVVGGHLTYVTTAFERQKRQELGEWAIQMLREDEGQGIDDIERWVAQEARNKPQTEEEFYCTPSPPSSETNEISSTPSADPSPSTTLET